MCRPLNRGKRLSMEPNCVPASGVLFVGFTLW